MIKHCVFLSLADPADLSVLDEPMQLLESLGQSVPGMIGFVHGPNKDFENKTPNHQYGFVCTFNDREAHLAYEKHPVHQKAGGMLIAACAGGYEGILVADIEAE
ncbi:stress responsive alpha/beta barrel protein [Roseibium hamelinense]|uniref:Stress responsive alpha/beta barrel protein n=1 Tax=Roseibium hamelinense TaxID=150831 RepID=A0A562SXF4_9HYPH|nr:Dabb family protein [Roseibium hamelinense]TWI86005.1 stress responsive alpha/beta barrel protein [Roseibium hamelinense]